MIRCMAALLLMASSQANSDNSLSRLLGLGNMDVMQRYEDYFDGMEENMHHHQRRNGVGMNPNVRHY